jgi:hypothetical protein
MKNDEEQLRIYEKDVKRGGVNNGFGNKKQEDLGRFLSKNNNDNNGFF